MTAAQLIPALIIPLVVWRVYTRVKRNIGRQPFRPKRTIASTIIFSVVILLIGIAAAKHPPALAALGGGLLAGIPLALFGLRLTKFESLPSGKFYTPNTYLALALTLFLVGRMAFRMSALIAAPQHGSIPLQHPFQSPLTSLMFGLLAGYYITLNIGVLKRMQALPTAASE